jgi:hypothetical protein
MSQKAFGLGFDLSLRGRQSIHLRAMPRICAPAAVGVGPLPPPAESLALLDALAPPVGRAGGEAAEKVQDEEAAVEEVDLTPQSVRDSLTLRSSLLTGAAKDFAAMAELLWRLLDLTTDGSLVAGVMVYTGDKFEPELRPEVFPAHGRIAGADMLVLVGQVRPPHVADGGTHFFALAPKREGDDEIPFHKPEDTDAHGSWEGGAPASALDGVFLAADDRGQMPWGLHPLLPPPQSEIDATDAGLWSLCKVMGITRDSGVGNCCAFVALVIMGLVRERVVTFQDIRDALNYPE